MILTFNSRSLVNKYEQFLWTLNKCLTLDSLVSLASKLINLEFNHFKINWSIYMFNQLYTMMHALWIFFLVISNVLVYFMLSSIYANSLEGYRMLETDKETSVYFVAGRGVCRESKRRCSSQGDVFTFLKWWVKKHQCMFCMCVLRAHISFPAHPQTIVFDQKSMLHLDYFFSETVVACPMWIASTLTFP